MNDELSNETRTRATDDAKYPERTADGDPFAAPRYWVRSRRHQGNSRRERED